MAFASLPVLPDGSEVFIDANIFVYALTGRSAQCMRLMERCSAKDLKGITLDEVVNDATHQLMLIEARQKRLITKAGAAALQDRLEVVASLSDYWQDTERILAIDLVFLGSSERLLRQAHRERQRAGLLTDDSIILACMRVYDIANVATSDRDFERTTGINVYRPDDL